MGEHEYHESANVTNIEKIAYKKLSYNIMQATFEVHNILGPGFSENIYEEALTKELQNRGITYERQRLVRVYYKGDNIGEYRLDLIVENKIILELKAVSELNDVFAAQLYSYLKATGMKLGILINFGTKRVQSKRIIN